MLDLRTHFITVDRPCKEGTVEVFEQPVSASGVRRATLTITALGVYEAELNGAKIGDLMFTPGYTYYPRNLHYQVYDVTALLAEDNLILWVIGYRISEDVKVTEHTERILEIRVNGGSDHE